jgi:hypothetical protein
MLQASAQVTTEKASRYLKALCNHFDRKVTAEYTDNHGTVDFGFGTCEMYADDNKLSIQIASDTPETFERVKYVVSDHLERFSGDEALQANWTVIDTADI